MLLFLVLERTSVLRSADRPVLLIAASRASRALRIRSAEISLESLTDVRLRELTSAVRLRTELSVRRVREESAASRARSRSDAAATLVRVTPEFLPAVERSPVLDRNFVVAFVLVLYFEPW